MIVRLKQRKNMYNISNTTHSWFNRIKRRNKLAYGKKFHGKNRAIFQVYLIWFEAFKLSTRTFFMSSLWCWDKREFGKRRNGFVTAFYRSNRRRRSSSSISSRNKTINVTNVRSMCLNIIYYWVGICFVRATTSITQTKRHKAQQHLIFNSLQSWWLIYDLLV